MEFGYLVGTERRFPVLRFLAVALRVLGWLALLSALALALLALFGPAPVTGMTGPMALPATRMLAGSRALLAGVSAGSGLLLFVLLYALGESLSLRLSLEESGRLTAALLSKMDQDYQQGR